VIKGLFDLIAVLLMLPAAASCWIERALVARSEVAFELWTHVMALAPGLPGLFVRRAFYRLTLVRCSRKVYIGFGALFTHPNVVVDDDVYVGPYAVIGCAHLREGSLIGTRANLLSGSTQHEMDEDGRWLPADASSFRQIDIGPHAWIGEAATVMANVGTGSAVAAGAVVAAPVPEGVVVAGNPARFVRASRRDDAQTTPQLEEDRRRDPFAHSVH
jgi:acetyltransferase-like isoleucine patch superfamily enzyme